MLVVLGQLRDPCTGLGGKFVEPGGAFTDGLAGAVGLRVALAHVVQRAPEQLVVASLLLEHRHVDRILEGVEQLGLLGQVDFQRLVHAGAGGCVAVGQHELQARDAQVRQVVVELCDLRHPAPALDDAAETAPAYPGQDEREGQDNAEAQDELAAYADTAKPVMHAGTSKKRDYRLKRVDESLSTAKEQLRCRHCCHELEREANRASRSKHLFGSLVIPCSAPIARTPPRARMAARSDRSAATKWRTNQPDRRACKAAYSFSLVFR